MKGKDYYVIGPRSALDTVEIGLFDSRRSAVDALPVGAKETCIRKATKQEVLDKVLGKYYKQLYKVSAEIFVSHIKNNDFEVIERYGRGLAYTYASFIVTMDATWTKILERHRSDIVSITTQTRR